MASPTTNKGYTYPAHNGSINSWDTPINADFDQIDLNVGGTYNVTGSSSVATVTFNATQCIAASTANLVTFTSSIAQNMYYKINGAFNSSCVLAFPSVGSFYVINNQCSSGSIYAGVTGNTANGVAISTNNAVLVVTDSSNAFNTVVLTLNSSQVQVATTSRLLGRTTAGSGGAELISATSPLSLSAGAITVGSATTAAAGVSELATAAEMVTGTDTTRVPSVSVVKNHDGVGKAWVYCTSSGAIQDSYGVSSVNHTGTGQYTVAFSTFMANALYSVSAAMDFSALGVLNNLGVSARTTNAVSIHIQDKTGSNVDNAFSIMVMGTLA